MDSFRENRSGGVLIRSYLQESTPHLHKGKLDASLRKKVNKWLRRQGFDGNSRFRSIGRALGEMAGVLDAYGIEVDEPITADRFRQDTGSTALHVAHSNPEEPMNPKRIPNSMLAIQWTDMRSGFEIVAYLS